MASCDRNCERCPYERKCHISCTARAIEERCRKYRLSKLEHGTYVDGIPGTPPDPKIYHLNLNRRKTNRLYEASDEL